MELDATNAVTDEFEEAAANDIGNEDTEVFEPASESEDVEATEDAETTEAADATEPTDTSIDSALLDRIEQAEQEVERTEAVLLGLKKNLKEAKEAHATSVVNLRNLARARLNDQNRPLFNQDGESDESGPEAEPNTDTATDWRKVSTYDLGIPRGVREILAENPDTSIKTLGDIATWCETYTLTDIPRIGESKAETIQNACDAYWEEHPQE